MPGIIAAVAVAYGVANLAAFIGAIFCLAFGKEDARFGGDKGRAAATARAARRKAPQTEDPPALFGDAA
jgi:hypothetical protein